MIQLEFFMIEIIIFGVFIVMLFLLAACSFGRGPSSGRVRVTSPDKKSSEGMGGARGYDYSYSGQSGMGSSKPFPVGLRTEREKTDTHEAYSKEDDDY
jgi:hypothetical protein